MPSASVINARDNIDEDSDEDERQTLLSEDNTSTSKRKWWTKRRKRICLFSILGCIGCFFVLFVVLGSLVPVLVHDANRLQLVVEHLTLYDLCNNPQSLSMTVRSTNPGFLPLKFASATVHVSTLGLPDDGPLAILNTPVDVPLGTAVRNINATMKVTHEDRASALLQQALDENGPRFDLIMTVRKIDGIKLPFPTSSIPDDSAVNMSVSSRAFSSPKLIRAFERGVESDGTLLGQGTFHLEPQNELCQVLPGLAVNITIGIGTKPIPIHGTPSRLCKPGPSTSVLNYTVVPSNIPIARDMVSAAMVGGSFPAIFTGGGGNTSCLVQRIFNGVRSSRTLNLEARGGDPGNVLHDMFTKSSLDISVEPDGKPFHWPCFLWCHGPGDTLSSNSDNAVTDPSVFHIPLHINGSILNQLPFAVSGIKKTAIEFSEYNHSFAELSLGPLPPSEAHGYGYVDANSTLTVTDEVAMSRLMNELIVDVKRRKIGLTGTGIPGSLLPPSSIEVGPLPDKNKLATLRLKGSNSTMLSLLYTGYFYNPGHSRLLLGKPDTDVYFQKQLVGRLSTTDEVVIEVNGTSTVKFNMDFIKGGSEFVFGEFMSRFAFAQPVDLHLNGTLSRQGRSSPVQAHFPKFWLQSLQVAADNFITNATITRIHFAGVPNPFGDKCEAVLTVQLYVHNPFGFPLNCDSLSLSVTFNDTSGSPPLSPSSGVHIGDITRETPVPPVPATSAVKLALPLPVNTFGTCWRLFYHRVKEGNHIFVDIPHSNITLSTGPFKTVIHEQFWKVPVEIVV